MSNLGISVSGSTDQSQAAENNVLLATTFYFKLLRDPTLFAEKIQQLEEKILEADGRIEEATQREKACEQTIAQMHADADAQIAEKHRVCAEECQVKVQIANEQASQAKAQADEYRLNVQNQMNVAWSHSQTRNAELEREVKEKVDKLLADAQAVMETAARDKAEAKAMKDRARQFLDLAESPLNT